MDRFLVKKPKMCCESASGDLPSVSVSREQESETSERQGQAHELIEVGVPTTQPTQPETRGADEQVSRRSMHKRNFQPHWKKTYPWVEYQQSKDAIFCQICKSAFNQKCVTFSSKLELSFIESGFRNWKKALEKLKKHEKSECHREAVFKLGSMKSGVNVSCQLSNAKKIEMEENRLALMKILTSLKFLVTQGLAIRGHTDESSSFVKLLKLRCEDCPVLKKWMSRESFKWCSHETCNEMLEIMSHHVTRCLVAEIVRAKHYAIMVDETSDISIQEQVSVCFRIVTEDLEIEELFLGFHSAPNTKSETLFCIIMDVLRRFNLPVTDCRGQCFDGARNMAGALSGVQARMKREEPRAIFVHCMAHNLSLTVQDLVKQINGCRNVLSLVQDIINFVRDSPKRLSIFKQLQSGIGEGSSNNLRPFCPTRWTVRFHSLSSILSNYSELINLMEELAESEKSDAGAKANGFIIQMTTFDFFFHLSLLCKVFGYVDTINSALQGKSLHFQQATEMISTLLQLLRDLRTQYETFWNDVNAKSEILCISQPVLPRKRRIPCRLDDVESREPVSVFPFNTPEDFYRQIFNEVVDTIVECITTRFKSKGTDFVVNAEQFLLGVKSEFNELRGHFKDDIDEERVILHRDMLLDILETKNERVDSVASVVGFLQKNPQVKSMLPELQRFVHLLLTIPVSTSTAERSFSSLRRLKSYLRSTMTQKRLNHLAILNVHHEVTNSLNMDSVANDFISRAEIRKSTFAVKM